MERLSRQPGGEGGMSLVSKALAMFGWGQKSADVVRVVNLTEPEGWSSDRNYAGVEVGERSVLALSAAWACVNLLAGTIASLPLMVYRTDAAGNRAVAKDHPLYRVLHDSPNADQTAMDFWEGGTASLELKGNLFARIDRSGPRVVSLTPIFEPTVRRLGDGSLRYRWTEAGKTYEEPQENVFHVRGFGGSPLGGLSTLSYGRQVFGLSGAVNIAAQSTFANGMRPTVALKTDKWLTEPQHDAMTADIAKRHAGAVNTGNPFIAHGGMDIVPLTINPDDAQMLESRAFSVEEIARLFGVPPHMIGHTEKSTSWGTGLEQQTLGFVQFTLRKRLKRIEQAIEKQLLSAADRAAGVTVEFNLEGLLRGDSKGRAEFFRAALGDTQKPGWMVRNEVRKLENLPPVDGWDEPIALFHQDAPVPEDAPGGDQ